MTALSSSDDAEAKLNVTTWLSLTPYCPLIGDSELLLCRNPLALIIQYCGSYIPFKSQFERGKYKQKVHAMTAMPAFNDILISAVCLTTPKLLVVFRL